MADTGTVVSPNGAEPEGYPDRRLPEVITMTASEMSRVPSPGTQRALKADTGRAFDELCGGQADSADRIQTFIWMKLRRQFEGLRWDECADVEIEVEEGAALVDPTKPADSGVSLSSAASGG